jgi:hypothetical protein
VLVQRAKLLVPLDPLPLNVVAFPVPIVLQELRALARPTVPTPHPGLNIQVAAHKHISLESSFPQEGEQLGATLEAWVDALVNHSQASCPAWSMVAGRAGEGRGELLLFEARVCEKS